MGNKKKEITMQDVMSGNVPDAYVDTTGITQAMSPQPPSVINENKSDENKGQRFNLTAGDRAMNFIAPFLGGSVAALQSAKQSAFRAMNNASKGEETSSGEIRQVSAGTNVAQNDQNVAGTISTSVDGGTPNVVTQVPGSGSIISLTPGRSMSLNTPNMQSNIAKQKNQMQSMFTQSDNKIRGSKSRMGLFGNYGKDVEIRKTYDPETNKITRSKFVDGEKVEKGKGFKGVRRAKRAGGFGRKQKLANSNNKSNNTNTNKNNNSGSSSNLMMGGGRFG